MGDSSYGIPREANLVMSRKKQSQNYLVASRSKASLHSLGALRIGNSLVGQAALFALKVAALEVARRFSRAKCPWAWRGFQALQFLCYPPFKWFRRFAPFKALVDNLQVCTGSSTLPTANRRCMKLFDSQFFFICIIMWDI